MGKVIGYTTGVFDLFHIGHLNILEQAKKQCDYLIVGVSTDELVKTYKGKTPLIPYEQRAAIVKAIRYVDEVVPQVNMDKREAWNSIHYNVLFHGDDWKGSEMYKKNEADLAAVGVKVIYIPHTKGISSSQIEKQLKGEKE